VAYHLGYEIMARNGERYSSAAWQDGALLSEPDVSLGRFRRVSEGLPLKRFMVPFAILVRLLAVPRLSDAFSSMVKRKMIRPSRELDIALTRRVFRQAGEIVVTDELVAGSELAVRNIRPTMDIAMHSPSARFDGAQALFEEVERPDWAEGLSRTGRLQISWTIPFETPQALRHAS
jgi:hypothetical protein